MSNVVSEWVVDVGEESGGRRVRTVSEPNGIVGSCVKSRSVCRLFIFLWEKVLRAELKKLCCLRVVGAIFVVTFTQC